MSQFTAYIVFFIALIVIKSQNVQHHKHKRKSLHETGGIV